MKYCPLCEEKFSDEHSTCPADGVLLMESHEWPEQKIVKGKYRILGKLGQGGMGIVYKAQHMLLGELRALKVMSPELARDPSFLRRFRQEAQAASRLKHLNIVQVNDLDQAEDGSLFMGMEYVEGMSLRDVLQSAGGPLEVARALAMARDIAEALNFAHAHGMVHRDIKPDNVLITRDVQGREVAKVMDFGIVAMKESTGQVSSGIIMTPAYAPPEQWRGMKSTEIDGRADLYALGMTLYEMLTGQMPFDVHTQEGWLNAHLNVPPAPPSKLNSAVTPMLDEIVLDLLAKERDERTSSAAALLTELKHAEEEIAAKAPVAPTARWHPAAPAAKTPQPPRTPAPKTPPPVGPSVPMTVPPRRATPRPARPKSAPPAPVPRMLSSKAPPTEFPPRAPSRKPLLILAGVAAFLILAALAAGWQMFWSAEAQMLRAVDRGELIVPAGDSAYDRYTRLKTAGLSSGAMSKLRERALPKIAGVLEQSFQRRLEGADLKASELDELVKLTGWAAELSPEDARAQARSSYAQGLRELVSGRAREALPLLRRATDLDPRWAPAWNDTGRAYVRLNDRIHAEESYRKAIETDANWVYPYVNLAGVYFFQKDWATAEQWYLRAAQVDSAYATPWYFLGQVYEAQRRPEEAVGAYEKAIELAKTRPSSAFNVDKVQERIQKVRAAIPPPPSNFMVRVFNCDDRCVIYLDGAVVRQVDFGQDTGWMPLGGIPRGPHRLTFEVWNELGAITYGFMVTENAQLRFNNVCGQVGAMGCFNNQPRPRGLAARFDFDFNY